MASILVIEEDEKTRLLLHEALRKEGHEVLITNTGNEAFTLFPNLTIDLVITDLSLGKAAHEALLTIRKNFPLISVVALSRDCENAEMDVLQIASRLGAKKLLTKPFTLESLRNAVKEALSSKL